MFSNLVGWANNCVRLNSYWCVFLQSGEMVGILSAKQNLGELKSPNTQVWPLTVDTIEIDL